MSFYIYDETQNKIVYDSTTTQKAKNYVYICWWKKYANQYMYLYDVHVFCVCHVAYDLYDPKQFSVICSKACVS